MIEDDAKTTGDVLSWGIGQEGQRYSPLNKITPENIGRLVPAWSFSFGGEKLTENIRALAGSVMKAKPSAAKGKYVRSVTISSTMGPGVRVDLASLEVQE